MIRLLPPLLIIGLLHGFVYFAMERSSWDSRLSDRWMRETTSPSTQELTSVIHLDIGDSDHQKRDDLTSRETYVTTLNLVAETDAKAFIFDMILPSSKGREFNLPFTDAMKNMGQVYLSVGLEPSKFSSEEYLNMAGLVHPGEFVPGSIPFVDSLLANSTDLNRAARGIGHITIKPDPDGVHRRIPLVYQGGEGKVLPATILKVVMDHWEVEDKDLSIRAGEVLNLKKADETIVSIPIDDQGRMTIDFLGPWGKGFPHLYLAETLKAEVEDEKFELFADKVEDRFILFADISTQSHDTGATPLEQRALLPTLHANALQQILDQRFFYPLSPLENLLLWALPALLLFGLGQLRSNWIFVLGSTLLFLGLYFLHRHAFVAEKWLTHPLNHLIAIGSSFLALFIYRHEGVLRARRRLRQQFASYIAPSVLERVAENPNFLNVVDRKEITVMFTDIAGFTRWSSSQDPVTIHRLLNEYFEAMTEIVFQHEGTIDKFIGDGLMVFYGDPVPQEDQTDRAIKTAIAMQKALDGFRETWKYKYELDIGLRVGINTGPCTVGNLGSSKRLDYTTVGANVNLAQRLESQCPIGEILISKRTLELQTLLKGELEPMEIIAKGYDEPIEVYRVDPTKF